MCTNLSDASLPLVNLDVNISQVNSTAYTPAQITLTDPLCRTDGNRQNHYRCKVKYRGSSSLSYQKKSFAIKLVTENDSALDVPILSIRESDSWILNAMAIDRIRMRDRLLFDVWNDMSAVPYATDFNQRNGTQGYFVELFINGQYHGLYCLTDKINRKLLNLKKTRTQADGSDNVRGLLLKCIAWGSSASLTGYSQQSMNSLIWNSWELKYPDANPSADTWQPLADLIDFCSTTSDEYFRSHFDEYFYRDNITDYHLFVTAFSLFDNVNKNTYLSTRNLNNGHRWLFTPWDLDCSLGGWWQGDHMPDSFLDYHLSANPFGRLLECDTTYLDDLKERWQQLSTTILSECSLAARLDAYAAQFEASGAWNREYARWNNNPVPLTTRIDEETDYVKQWIHNSFAIMESTFGTTAAGISQPQASPSHTPRRYNLFGQPVGADYKGIVIEDGKKKVVR